VSLLAEARGHRALPSVMTLQDLRSNALQQISAGEIDGLIERSLRPITSDQFTLTVYFGRNIAKRHSELASALFRLFPAPLLRASFVRDRNGEWSLRSVTVMSASSIPDEHQEFAINAAQAWFEGRTRPSRRKREYRFDLAILVDDSDATSPSNEKALKKFEHAAEDLAISTERITKNDYSRLAEFDGLFIRVTTAVNHYTYRFARRAEAEHLVVIDDPQSILRCTNKVYLAESLERAKIPTPRTRIITKDNLATVGSDLGFPLILKRPDSSTSLGVAKVETAAELKDKVGNLLNSSDMLIGQEFMPTEFDWRIGILDGSPLFAAKYFMAPGHWQIVNHSASTRNKRYGDSDCVAITDVPDTVLKMAVKAAALIGAGFYGVDVKESSERWYVIEINDNPSVDRGVEDALVGDGLYSSLMDVFLRRMGGRRDGKERM
jgi:glutathione synthase/RimK-type ligase-like ATP-grasp enzyme